MSGPTERIRLELVDDVSTFDLGEVLAEVEPLRAWRGLISAEGSFLFGVLARRFIERLVALQLAGMKGLEAHFRVTPSGSEPVVLAYVVEAFAWRGPTFSLLLTREPDTSPMFAHPKHGDDESEADNGYDEQNT